MKKQIAAMVFGLALHAPAMAGLAEGVSAYNEQNYAAALKDIAPLAEAGDADAQHLLGLMYYMGRGVPRDHAAAFLWHRKAADQGLPAAQYVVGAMLYTGNGVARDQTLAVAWFRKAAEGGHPDAQYALGLMYRYHVAGLPEDTVLAYMLWDLATAGGHRSAGEQRAELAHRMTARQVAQAQCMARHWQPGMPLPARPRSGSSAS